MILNFFRKRKIKKYIQDEELHPAPLNKTNSTMPQIYRGIMPFEPEDFCPFDEDYFAGENYEREKRRPIPPPKTPPSFFLGVLLGTITILFISGGITFFTLFSKFGSEYSKIIIPDFTKLSVTDAIEEIKKTEKFNYSIKYQENPSLPAGTVISQYPNPNTQRKLYKKGEKIELTITVNKKREAVTLPNVIGQDARRVSLELKNAGINVEVKEAFSDSVKFGKIISVSHKSGAKLDRTSTVILTKSIGKKINYLNVPSLLGISETEALSILKQAGFDNTEINYENSHYPKGLVIKQSIDEGTSVREGTKIILHVSIGKS